MNDTFSVTNTEYRHTFREIICYICDFLRFS